MAPALTDTAAHSATFKLPASPANPGFEGLYSLSSPDLPAPDPVLSTKHQSLSDELRSFDRIVSELTASVPEGDFNKNKRGLNGCQGFIHLENLTQLMKSKDTKSVIELLSGINGNNQARHESAGLRSTMNGSDPDLSDKVKSADISNPISLSEQLNSFSRELLRANPPGTKTNQSGKKDTCSNEQDPFMVVESSDDLTAASNPCTGLGDSMVVDSELPLQLDAEALSESTNSACPKDTFSFEEKVLSTAEDLLSGLAESSPPTASTFIEDDAELADLTATSLEDTLSRQQTLRDRSIRLVDRLRKLQFAQVGLHAKDEIGWFTSRVQRDAAKVSPNDCLVCKQRRLCLTDNSVFVPCEKHADGPLTKPRPPPTLVQRIITRGDGKVFHNIEKIHRRLQSNLVHLQDQIDSEATDSSSDESDEESEFKLKYQEGPNRGYDKLSVNRRAIWKWAQHRAGVARRWTWLQAQVSDLEYRIRQHSDIYRQIKAAKGTVTLETRPSASSQERHPHRSGHRSGRRLPPTESKADRLESTADHAVSPSSLSSVLSNVDHQSARLHKSLSNCLAPSGRKPTLQLNGCVHSRSLSGDPLLGLTKTYNHRNPSSTGDHVSTEPPEERHCARTRQVRFHRKRRLVRSSELSHYSPKARRLSSVGCGCCPPSMCVMCGGRFNKTKPLNPFSMPVAEKASHLSPGFHQVLSFPGDIPLPVHFESLLNRGDSDRRWKVQKRQSKSASPPGQLKTKKRNLKRLHKLRNNRNPSTPNNLPLSQAFYKFNHLRDQRDGNLRAGTIRVLPRSKSDSVSLLQATQADGTTSEEELRRCQNVLKRRRSQAAESERKSRERSTSLPIPGVASGVRTNPEGRAPAPTTQFGFLPAATLPPNKKALPGDAYDIDNIVIPYDMLASTRVEKLHYKEIDTPQWRVVVNGKVMDLRDSLGAEAEDVKEEAIEDEESLSDTEYTERHLRYEIKEKKKFLAILAKQGAAAIAAGRRSRRTRNNSTASTPDPLSPGLPSSENCSLSGSFDAASPLSPSPLLDHYRDLTSTPVATETIVPRHLRSSSADRRRTSFASDSSKSVSFDEPEPVQGWPRRSFPLGDDEVEEMNFEQEEEEASYDFYSPGGGPVSLGLDSDEESFGEDLEPEDPKDPEWTVVTRRRPQRSESLADDDPLVLHLKCAAKKEKAAMTSPATPAGVKRRRVTKHQAPPSETTAGEPEMPLAGAKKEKVTKSHAPPSEAKAGESEMPLAGAKKGKVTLPATTLVGAKKEKGPMPPAPPTQPKVGELEMLPATHAGAKKGKVTRLPATPTETEEGESKAPLATPTES